MDTIEKFDDCLEQANQSVLVHIHPLPFRGLLHDQRILSRPISKWRKINGFCRDEVMDEGCQSDLGSEIEQLSSGEENRWLSPVVSVPSGKVVKCDQSVLLLPMRTTLVPRLTVVTHIHQQTKCSCWRFLIITGNRYSSAFYAHRMKETSLANSGILKVAKLGSKCFMYERLFKMDNAKLHINMGFNHLASQSSALVLEAVAPAIIMHSLQKEDSLTLDNAVDYAFHGDAFPFGEKNGYLSEKMFCQVWVCASKEADALCESNWVDIAGGTRISHLFGKLFQQLFDEAAIVLKNYEKFKKMKGPVGFRGGK